MICCFQRQDEPSIGISIQGFQDSYYNYYQWSETKYAFGTWKSQQRLAVKQKQKKDQMEGLEMKSSWVDMTEERVSDLKLININYLREKKRKL